MFNLNLNYDEIWENTPGYALDTSLALLRAYANSFLSKPYQKEIIALLAAYDGENGYLSKPEYLCCSIEFLTFKIEKILKDSSSHKVKPDDDLVKILEIIYSRTTGISKFEDDLYNFYAEFVALACSFKSVGEILVDDEDLSWLTETTPLVELLKHKLINDHYQEIIKLAINQFDDDPGKHGVLKDAIFTIINHPIDNDHRFIFNKDYCHWILNLIDKNFNECSTNKLTLIFSLIEKIGRNSIFLFKEFFHLAIASKLDKSDHELHEFIIPTIKSLALKHSYSITRLMQTALENNSLLVIPLLNCSRDHQSSLFEVLIDYFNNITISTHAEYISQILLELSFSEHRMILELPKLKSETFNNLVKILANLKFNEPTNDKYTNCLNRSYLQEMFRLGHPYYILKIIAQRDYKSFNVRDSQGNNLFHYFNNFKIEFEKENNQIEKEVNKVKQISEIMDDVKAKIECYKKVGFFRIGSDSISPDPIPQEVHKLIANLTAKVHGMM